MCEGVTTQTFILNDFPVCLLVQMLGVISLIENTNVTELQID